MKYESSVISIPLCYEGECLLQFTILYIKTKIRYNERISANAAPQKSYAPACRRVKLFVGLCESNEHRETEGFEVSAYA